MALKYGAAIATQTSAWQVCCAAYARFSSKNQKFASIEDQLRNCRSLAESRGWILLEEHIYIDEERTGKTQIGRDGFETMMAASVSKQKPFTYIICDDVSRFGRNKADLFRTIDILTFNQVYVYFVEDGLDSKEPWFEESFHARAQQAARYSTSLSSKVRRGREGRFLAGYNPGGGCYGYKNVPDQDFTRRGEYGRPAVRGVLQEIDPEQVVVVLRIAKAYAAGMSLSRIAKMLNDEGIPPSQRARTRKTPTWSKSAIKAMLKNERYCGRVRWNTTTQVLNPETGKYEVQYNPESEWLTMEHPHLRIIPEELWKQVQDQFVRATRGYGVKRMGGMNRTERSRRYLFSGLLRCGVCGGKVIITDSNPPRYGCADHRDRNACSNKATLLVANLETTFLSALALKLGSESVREDIGKELLAYLNSARGKAIQDQLDGESERKTIEETLRTLRLQQGNLVDAIRNAGHSRALLADLAEVEARISRMEERLEAAARPPMKPITEEEVRSFVADEFSSIQGLLREAPETVRHHLQKRISTITLTPIMGEPRSTWRAEGDVGLFSGPSGALQSNQGPPIALHYTLPVSFEIRKTRRALPITLAA